MKGHERITYTHRKVLLFLQSQREQHVSYEEMVDKLAIDVHTAVRAVRRLEAAEHIVKVQGRGRTANRYIVNPPKQHTR